MSKIVSGVRRGHGVVRLHEAESVVDGFRQVPVALRALAFAQAEGEVDLVKTARSS